MSKNTNINFSSSVSFWIAIFLLFVLLFGVIKIVIHFNDDCENVKKTGYFFEARLSRLGVQL